MYSKTPAHVLLSPDIEDDRSSAVLRAMRRVNDDIIARWGHPDCLLSAWNDPAQHASIVHCLEIALKEEVAVAAGRGDRSVSGSRNQPFKTVTGHPAALTELA